ncbi:FAD-dependent oxidoreductase [Modestobacter sp. NPDC049651]|uniref:FAD-dependent oxidoreductase n=1 Tax=unclassified Modestobacter TaxID=2643866 RepID=UPI0034001C73
MTTDGPYRVAVVGAGPAGFFTADALSRHREVAVEVDLLERLPAPFGLIRYGVAPDHPKVSAMISRSLHRVMARGRIRFLGNVELGTDVTLADLRAHYDAVVLTTGASRDAELRVPGAQLPGSHGAAEFVSWYAGHPEAPRTWPLDTPAVAVVGAGNVALDVARMLVRDDAALAGTDVPDEVLAQLAAGAVTDVHLLARRGPAQARFTPLELRELGEVPGVDVVVDPADLQFDDASRAAVAGSHQVAQVVEALTGWAAVDPASRTAPRRLHLHFLTRPVRVLGTDRVTGVEVERTELTGDGTVRGTGETTVLDVQAVYRAVGYRSSPLPGVPFDEAAGVVPNAAGRVLGPEGDVLPGLYASGWVKRGAVGLIGHTKSDAAETVGHLAADLPGLPPAAVRDPAALPALLAARGVHVVEWSGWELLDELERSLGAQGGRERVKVVDRAEMLRAARGAAAG